MIRAWEDTRVKERRRFSEWNFLSKGSKGITWVEGIRASLGGDRWIAACKWLRNGIYQSEAAAAKLAALRVDYSHLFIMKIVHCPCRQFNQPSERLSLPKSAGGRGAKHYRPLDVGCLQWSVLEWDAAKTCMKNAVLARRLQDRTHLCTWLNSNQLASPLSRELISG